MINFDLIEDPGLREALKLVQAEMDQLRADKEKAELEVRELRVERHVAQNKQALAEKACAEKDDALKAELATHGHRHWDETMQHGAGCPICIQQHEAAAKTRIALSSTCGQGYVKAETAVCATTPAAIWVRHPWDADEPMCVCCGISMALKDGCEWDDDPDLNLCANCALTVLRDIRSTHVSREELRPTIELEKYLVQMLNDHYRDGHKDGCICWTCTARRDVERDLARLQKLTEPSVAGKTPAPTVAPGT